MVGHRDAGKPPRGEENHIAINGFNSEGQTRALGDLAGEGYVILTGGSLATHIKRIHQRVRSKIHHCKCMENSYLA
jgi:hypothetical protein